jgi:hypothetical protein
VPPASRRAQAGWQDTVMNMQMMAERQVGNVTILDLSG